MFESALLQLVVPDVQVRPAQGGCDLSFTSSGVIRLLRQVV